MSRPKAYIKTTAGEIPVLTEYDDLMKKWKTAIETGDPVIETRKAAGGDFNYSEEEFITVAVSAIVAIQKSHR